MLELCRSTKLQVLIAVQNEQKGPTNFFIIMTKLKKRKPIFSIEKFYRYECDFTNTIS